MTKEKTLMETEPEYFNLLAGLHDTAFKKMDSPDFVRVLPPPGG